MRELVRVPADPETFPAALARALAGVGPALLPTPRGGASGEPVSVPDEIAVVIETSGSTAAPKRVLLTASAVRASARATHEALGGPGDWVLAVPVHYVAGLMVVTRALEADTALVRASGLGAEAVVSAIENHLRERRHARPLYSALVPSQLADVLSLARTQPAAAAALAEVDAFLVGGQRIAPSLLAEASASGITVVPTYGSSETAGGCVYAGRPIGDTRIRIDDDRRIHIASSSLAAGYLDADATATAFSIDAHGTRWWASSDIGSVDEEGVLSVAGRVDDVIISGGIKVTLGEVESTARSLPGLRDAVAVAVDDARWGQAIVVFGDGAVPPGERLSLARLRAHIGDALRREARPRALVWLPEGIPLTATGKPDRRALTEKATTMGETVTDFEDDA